MSLEFIYQKKVNLNNVKSFTISMPEKNSVGKKIISDERHLLSSLDLRLKTEVLQSGLTMTR